MHAIRARALSGVALCCVAILAGCSGGPRAVGGGTPDLAAMRAFDRHPLYWVGGHFEQWDLERVEIGNTAFVSLSYGTCKLPQGIDPGGCPVPLEIQIQPLCTQLEVVTRAPIWQRREVRGAPVGTIDSAPVMFTNKVQIKVYRGQGSDRGLALRALRALRSANAVEPVIHPGDPIPPPPPGVLAGTAPVEFPDRSSWGAGSARHGARDLRARVRRRSELATCMCSAPIAGFSAHTSTDVSGAPVRRSATVRATRHAAGTIRNSSERCAYSETTVPSSRLEGGAWSRASRLRRAAGSSRSATRRAWRNGR